MAGFAGTLPELLEPASEKKGRFVFLLDSGDVELTFRDLAARARRATLGLAARGVRRGDRVGLLGPNRPQWPVSAYGIWSAGAALVPIGLPMRLRDPEAFRDQIAGLKDGLGLRTIVADPMFLSVLPEGSVSWDELEADDGPEPEPPHPEDPATIQLTSGSTAEPKGALLTHATIRTHLARSYEGIERWRPLGWVPFFHDWGLVTYVLRVVQKDLIAHMLPTERFARDPVQLLRLLGPTGANEVGGPPSAWGAILRSVERDPGGIDLTGVWVSLGAETVEPALVDRMLEVLGPLGLSRESLGVGYGLAEAVLGVASTYHSDGFKFDEVDLAELVESGRAAPVSEGPTKRVASCGRSGRGFGIRIVDPATGEDLPERHVGEIRVKGPSMMHTYIGQDPPNPFVDGWLCTGDLGYLADGDLYVTGRLKDMIIVGGHNYYPEDFEWAANRVEGARPGRCVAFSRNEREIVLLVEPRENVEPERLAVAVRSAVADAVGIRPADVLVVPKGTIQKTTSGKLRRGAMREAYLRGELRDRVTAEP